MGKPGRPTKLTPEVEEKILRALRGGNFREVAAAYAGVAKRTFLDWMKAGKDNPDSRMGEFRARVVEAEKGAELHAVATIIKAGGKDHRAMEWFLERKFPERWGRTAAQKHEVTGSIGVSLDSLVAASLIPKDDKGEGEK